MNHIFEQLLEGSKMEVGGGSWTAPDDKTPPYDSLDEDNSERRE